MNESECTRFWAKVARAAGSGCWEWLASVNVRDGYGQYRIKGKTRRAHIVAYELVVGRVPLGLVLDHICRNRRCVNPAHLDPVTLGENTRRGMSPTAIASRTNRCLRGHAFTDGNTIKRANGKRECRTCDNVGQRRRHQARKQAA